MTVQDRDKLGEPPPSWFSFVRNVPRHMRWLWRIEWRLRWALYALRHSAVMKLLEIATLLSVPIALGTYLLGGTDRARERLYRSAEVIARPPNTIADAARRAAMEDLAANNISLVGVRLPDSTFMWGTDLRGAVLDRSELRSLAAVRSNFGCRRSPVFRKRCVYAEFADWRGIVLYESNLRDIDLWLADLGGADLSGADLELATLYGVNLTRGSLRRASLRNALVHSGTFTLADLRGADLHGLRAWRSIRDLRYANIAGVRNPPPGFVRWAVDSMQAVMLPDSQWNVLITGTPAARIAQESRQNWCRIRPTVACGKDR